MRWASLKICKSVTKSYQTHKRSLVSAMVEAEVCQRCSLNACTVVSRKTRFCDDCFTKFVFLKQRKQMMSDDFYQNVFKVLYADKIRSAEEADLENQKSKILVPLSLGSSSLVALDILNDTLSEQKQSHGKKAGFKVDVLICYLGEEFEVITKLVTKLRSERFSTNLDCMQFHFVNLDQYFSEADELHSILLHHVHYTAKYIESHDKYCLSDILQQLSNNSSRADLINIVRTYLIKKYASQNAIKAILWGHSMTKLADEVISLIVKGRGSEIADLFDNSSLDIQYGSSFKNLHPLKDVLLSEIDAYAHILKLEKYIYNYTVRDTLLVNKFVSCDSTSNPVKMPKNSTINELARQYFDDIEEDYSNVISTVVRTGSKLGNPPCQLEEKQRCSVCNNDLYLDASRWLESITINEGHPTESSEEKEYYRLWKEQQQAACAEKQSLEESIWEEGKNTSICYGCIVILNSLDNRTLHWPSSNHDVTAEVLEEFVIADDDEE
ncbi:HCL436Cp [Eremothecium sinecaudum]|uniref:Cytoplasmic tRNA 2-thiolation protein 2 n=1 Tax=Eremothecium sinecaudum TaxID=45286 RepID=A0A109UY92_9SACH|nr:HCL436Cp [Eremothecium sinecaudum]AMD19715.1 HCL436Cp [Eremothecium sinecaudum]